MQEPVAPLKQQSPFKKRVQAILERTTLKLDAWNARLFPTPQPQDAKEKLPEHFARGAIITGMWSVILIFGIFGAWAAFAPLYSAAVSSGHVVLDSNRKTIQHLEGGIVKKIYVKEGDKVKKDQPLVALDATTTKARLDIFVAQSINSRAAEARLKAERDGDETITFPKDMLEKQDTDKLIDENIDAQTRLFKSRRESLDGRTAVLKQKIEQMKKEIDGMTSQEKSAKNQLDLLQEEIGAVKKLLAQGNASKPRLLALEREYANIQGRRGEYLANMARAQQQISEAEIQIINLQSDFQNEVLKELKEMQTQNADLDEKIRASADAVMRITIHSPISGVVTGLKVHTIGGVIAPGAAIMDIVPQNDKLIIETKVQLQDIDVVHTGLLARVRLTAYKTRKVPTIDGSVVNVSADSFTNEHTGEQYYIARVEIDSDELDKLDELDNVKLYPGMPAEVQIITGRRTFLSYLLTPITDSVNNALREQ